MMNYQAATWRIEICRGVHVEITVQACASDREVAQIETVSAAAAVLKDVVTSLKRVQARWQHIK